MAFFFFSSRRRHTRSKRDWSSDVCSSDLSPTTSSAGRGRPRAEGLAGEGDDLSPGADPELPAVMLRSDARSEERRVGKECRSRWWRYHEKKKTRNVWSGLVIVIVRSGGAG